MAWDFGPTSMWLWRRKDRESSNPKGSSSNPSSDSGTEFEEPEPIDSPLVCSSGLLQSSPRRANRKRRSREAQQIDREYDLVLVPPDGGCLSGSESDDSDWSIGWSEPHGPEFQSNGKVITENSFAVLVPCYGRRRSGWTESSTDRVLGVIDLSAVDSSENRKYVEDWLSSLQRS